MNLFQQSIDTLNYYSGFCIQYSQINFNFNQARKLSATSDQILMIDPGKRSETLPDLQNNFRREIKNLPDIGKYKRNNSPQNRNMWQLAW